MSDCDDRQLPTQQVSMGDCGDKIDHRQLPIQQESLSMPVSRQRIFSFDLVKEGDYLIEDQVIKRHCLVESVSSDFTECTVIDSWRKLIVRRKLNVSKSMRLYKLDYDPGACPRDVELVVNEARKLVGQRLFAKKFARKRFVHYLKTGRDNKKVSFTDIPDKFLLSSAMEQPVGSPLSVVPVDNSQINSLKEGDHIIYTSSSPGYAPVYRSALIVDLNIPQNELRLMTLIGCLDAQVAQVGVVEKSVRFCEFRNLHKVTYTSSLSSMEAIKRAKIRFTQQEQGKEKFHSWNNNSHLLVTWCKTGKEDPLTGILTALRDQDRENASYSVLFKTPVQTYSDIAPGDHLMCKSNHFLVDCVSDQRDKFSAYTIQSGKCTLREGIKLNKGTYKIEYGEFASRNSEESLQLAKDNCSKKTWNCSCRFVTEMKCGIALFIDDRCLIDSDVSVVSCTKVSTHVSVEVGDHLVIKAEGSEFHSALVSSCIDEYKFRILPPLILPQSEFDEIDILSSTFNGKVYRLNYKQSLPSDEVLKRARCKDGVSKQRQYSRWDYVTWAKVGKTIQTPDLSCLKEDEGFINLCSNVHRYYEIILSPSDIRVGDHIFINRGSNDSHLVLYREHMLVTGLKENTVFKVAFCLRTYVKETEVDLGDFEVYRIRYSEELSSKEAVKRARSIVGEHKFCPLARMWFVTWAKTGFDSVEVSLLRNCSNPTSKSKISSFTQLNPGDYLVRQRKWCHYRHYLVLLVESPTQCTVCESRCRKIREINLTWTDESHSYYRINYEANVCFKREQSIQHAKTLLGDRDLSIMSYLSRQRFVHYLKTGERMIVNVDKLSDDHFMSLKQEKIISTSDLKRGDHVFRAIGKKLFKAFDATHHMLIDDSCSADEQTIKVLHYQVSRVRFQKGTIANEHVNLFERGELFRTTYPDSIDPKEAIEKLKGYIAEDERIPYNLLSSNCEHLITGVITGVAFSSQVEHVFSKLMKFSRSSVKNNFTKCASHSSRDIAIHSGVHHAAAAKIRLAQRILLIKSALATGGITLALNVFLETPLLVRKIYKLIRRRKFHDISDVELKRHIIQEVCESVGVCLGSVLGAVIGQIFIPIPMLGSIVGGIVGVILGHFFGALFGWLVSKIVRGRRPVSLPMVYCKEPLPVD